MATASSPLFSHSGRIIVPLGNEGQIVQHLMEQNIPFSNKIIMALTHLFPFVRDEVRCPDIQFINSEYPDMEERSVNLGSVSMAAHSFYCAGMCILILSRSYTRPDDLRYKLRKRYIDIMGNGGMKPISDKDFTVVFDFLNPVVPVDSNIVLDMIGTCVARNKKFEYDPDVDANDLASVEDLLEHFNVSQERRPYMVGLRLAYENCQSTSLRFGVSIVKTLLDLSHSIPDKFKREATTLLKVFPHSKVGLYTGCRSDLPHSHRIKLYPRIVYIGLLYHGRTLLPGNERDNWSQYNVTSVTKHIREQFDRAICECIANMLPDPMKQ